MRKSTLFAPAFVEGWAHYCEQMMLDEGFRRNETGVRLGQLAEALVRLARFIVGIRLHCEDWSVEQGVRFFRDEAYLEEGSAAAKRSEARSTHVRALFSGQADGAEAARRLKAQQGAKYCCAASTTRCWRMGRCRSGCTARLMLGESNGVALE